MDAGMFSRILMDAGMFSLYFKDTDCYANLTFILSGADKHRSAQLLRKENESDGPPADDGRLVHDGQHLHHHVRAAETLVVLVRVLQTS